MQFWLCRQITKSSLFHCRGVYSIIDANANRESQQGRALPTLKEVQPILTFATVAKNSDLSSNMGVYEKFFFTILNDVEKYAILREKVLFLIFYITREIRTTERLFEICY